MEVIIIRNLSHRISTQGFSIRMPHTWSVYYLEAEVLQHIDPFAPPAMCV
jgi:hypothetical protein